MAKINPIEYLVDRKFFVTAWRYSSDTVDDDIYDYRMYLQSLTQEQVAELVKEEQGRELFDEDRFNTPMHWIDYSYWGKMPFWYLDEAVALSVGLSPERVNWDTIEPIVGHSQFPLASQYAAHRELALRATNWRQLSDPVEPTVFIAWVDRVNIGIPDELRTSVSKHLSRWSKAEEASHVEADHNSGELIQRLQSEVRELQEQLRSSVDRGRSDEGLSKKEAKSLYKLIYVMATKHYRWKSADRKSEVPSRIASDCERNGLRLDTDTVRKWLRRAAEELKGIPDPDGG